MSELDDRRQRAREAAYDKWETSVSPRAAVEEAIETATRVRITPEMVTAAHIAGGGYVRGRSPREWVETTVEAAFKAAGFEVEG